MKVMIAYDDDSTYADNALDDWQRAGLPLKSEAFVSWRFYQQRPEEKHHPRASGEMLRCQKIKADVRLCRFEVNTPSI